MDDEEAQKATARWQARIEKLLTRLVHITELEYRRPRKS
ncbi:hypothetical protein LCGC14_0643990 [marine sediment metagenome]|uniref:Uncharacterized protein n=1 Tax=marine sediment metagenome TaxID=412755 RepID=A0A0F9QYG1_9ZZZZ